jgi:hypothetical protein
MTMTKWLFMGTFAFFSHTLIDAIGKTPKCNAGSISTPTVLTVLVTVACLCGLAFLAGRDRT